MNRTADFKGNVEEGEGELFLAQLFSLPNKITSDLGVVGCYTYIYIKPLLKRVDRRTDKAQHKNGQCVV